MSDAPDPDFDLSMLTEFFDAAYNRDPTDKYVEPGSVNIKLGFYFSYELLNADAAALKKAAAADAAAKTKAEAEKKPAPAATVSSVKPTTRTQGKTAVKVKMPIPGSKGTFTIPMKYVVRFADVTMKLTDKNDSGFDLDRYIADRETAGQPLHLHLTATRTMGDALHDDDAELKRCNFPFHEQLAKQSQSSRKAYTKNLKDITFVPTEAGAADSMLAADAKGDKPAYWSSVGMEFKKALAEACTYDVSGDYFGKWSAAAHKAKHRSYVGPHLSEGYLVRATGEYELEQGNYYGLLLSPVVQRLYRLRRTPKDGWAVDLLIGLDESMLIPPAWDQKAKDLPTPDLIFFYTAHGLPHGRTKGLKTPSFYYHHVAKGAHRRLADPQREVTGDIGEKAAKDLRARSDFDWFVELAKLRFTDNLYTLDIADAMATSRKGGGAGKLAFLPQLRERIRNELAPPMWEWAGKYPLRLATLEPMKKLFEDENKLVLQQGMTVNDDVKFVGIHDGFAYLRDVKRDVTLKTPIDAFLEELVENEKFLTFYKNSEGMIYISQIIVWGGLAVMGVALIPGAIAARTVYRVVAKRVRDYALDKAAKQILIYELPALAAGLAGIIAGLFEGESDDAKRWKAFAKGFFKGYAVNTLKKIFMDFDAERVAKVVLKEYYLYKKLKKLHQTVKQLSEKFDELSAKLDKKSVTALVTKFEETAGRSLQSALVLFQLLSYLEHAEAEDILTGLSAALSEDPLESLRANEWYAEAKEGVIDSVEAIGKFVNGKGKGLFEAVDGVFTFLDEHEEILAAGALALTVARIAKTMAQLKTTKDTKTSPKKIIVVVLALIGGGIVADFATDGKSTRLMGDLGKSIRDALPGDTDTNAEHRGEICGRALGALFFDHGLIGSKSALGRVAKHDKIAKRLRKEAKHGVLLPMLTVLLQRYVIFYRKALGHDGKGGDVEQLFKDLGTWRTSSDAMANFNKFRSKTSKGGADIYEVISAVLHIDEFLEKEVRERWAAKWGPKLDSYAKDLSSFRSDAQTLGIEQLVKDHAPVIGYSMLMHLRVVVRNIKLSFKTMIEEVELPDGSKISLFGFIDMLGFDMGDLEGAVKEFDDHMVKVTEDFKTS